MIPPFLRLVATLSLTPVLLPAADLPPMLDLPGASADPTAIAYESLPVLEGDHALITAGQRAKHNTKETIFDRAELDDPGLWHFRLHNYLAHFDGQYWAIWSHGRLVEDHPGQHVRYATSQDGLAWSEPRILVPPSEQKGFRYIARGLWIREGKLLALASHDEAYRNGRVHFFGPSLDLRAWEWQPETKTWKALGVIADQAINNFSPLQLPNGQWGMICRGSSYQGNVFMLTGGVTAVNDWKRSPIVAEKPADGFHPEEPDWWPLPDGRLLGLFRDNARSGRFYRALSTDNGLTWSAPEKTNYPDATSKFFGLRTSKGYYVLISNANPQKRNPLCLATSDDGITFTRLARLPVPAKPEGGAFDASHSSGTLQYPHAIEHDGHLLIAYSRQKTTIEVVKISLDEIDRLRR